MTIEIRRLSPQDAAELFRRQALIQEPFAFLSSPEDDLATSPKAVGEQLSTSPDGSAVFGALDGDRLIGMVGLSRDRPVKAAHRVCVWGVFVDKEYRRSGVGFRLIESALDYARELKGVAKVYLSVSEKDASGQAAV